MIPNFFFIIIDLFLLIVIGVFSLVTFTVPPQIASSLTYLINYFNYARGIVPVNDLLEASIAILTAWILIYSVKVFLWGFSIIPFFGKKTDLPKHSGGGKSGGRSSFKK